MPDNTSCLSLFVAVMNSSVKAEKISDGFSTELRKDEDYHGLDQYAYLDPVTKLSTSVNPIYDEGDIRLLYIDHMVSVEFIITDSSNVGAYIGGAELPENYTYTFNERLARLEYLLRHQGLGINFGGFPSPIRKLAPTDENNTNLVTPNNYTYYKGNEGWLIDNFNGPKTTSLEFSHMVGTEAIRVTWQFKARVSHTIYQNTTSGENTFYLIPKISQEIRLDVDQEGDLTILLSGTIYADSLSSLYQARDYLELTYIPAAVQDIRIEDGQVEEYNRWAMINGFNKDVQFNIEKNGRSAQFRIKYTQVKSNNAFFQGIRDMKFEQSVESDLMSSAFRKWIMKFKGEIRIPSRMNAIYAWYIFNLLILQQTRRTTSKIDNVAKEHSSEDSALITPKMIKEGTVLTAFPTRIKIQHNHYQRLLKFEMDFWLFSTIDQLATASCIFDRINNDYQIKLDKDRDLSAGEQNDYVPRALSFQWFEWTKSVDPTNAFDPETLRNPLHPGRPNRDTAGTEVLDTGHNYDAYVALSQQKRQKNVMITTVIDPNDRDAQYLDKYGVEGGYNDIEAKDNVRFRMRAPTFYKPKAEVDKDNNFHAGLKQESPLTVPAITRALPDIAPEVSWMKYDQTYTITETNPTLPVESLSSISIEHFNGTNSENPNYSIDELTGEIALAPGPLDPSLLSQKTGTYFHGRASTIEPTEEPLSPGDPGYVEGAPLISKYKRKTYAVKPSRFYVTVHGQAIRAKYKIPIPVVIEIAGQKAIKVGTGTSKHKTIMGDADVPVYLATWEQTYTIDNTMECADILASIKDTGSVVLYV